MKELPDYMSLHGGYHSEDRYIFENIHFKDQVMVYRPGGDSPFQRALDNCFDNLSPNGREDWQYEKLQDCFEYDHTILEFVIKTSKKPTPTKESKHSTVLWITKLDYKAWKDEIGVECIRIICK